jgi:NADPH:quinone reductase-like Zn-dependent oxidoreductase
VAVFTRIIAVDSPWPATSARARNRRRRLIDQWLTTHSAVRNAPPSVEVVDVDEPEGVGELVRVVATGICASDLKYLRWGSTQIAGHEFAGVLEDGTAVAVEGFFGCGKCAQCEQGTYNMCTAGPPTAPGMLSPGGMSEWFRAPRHVLVPLPPGLDVADASLVEPGSVAWHSCHRVTSVRRPESPLSERAPSVSSRPRRPNRWVRPRSPWRPAIRTST